MEQFVTVIADILILITLYIIGYHAAFQSMSMEFGVAVSNEYPGSSQYAMAVRFGTTLKALGLKTLRAAVNRRVRNPA